MLLAVDESLSFVQKAVIPCFLIFILLGGCQPKNISQLSDKQSDVESIFNCTEWTKALEDLKIANGENLFQVSKYDNTTYPYFLLEPGQSAIYRDTLVLRLKNDLNFAKYLNGDESVKVQLQIAKTSTSSISETIDSLIIDRAYFEKNRVPYFRYKFPLNDKEIIGLPIKLIFSSTHRECAEEILVHTSCCDGKAWENVSLKRTIPLPELEIETKTYHYAGFTGILDITFDNNSSAIQGVQQMLARVQQQIDRFEGLDYRIEAINISGYASIKGAAELNRKLSTDRAQTLYQGLLQRNPEIEIEYEGLGEDWELTEKILSGVDFSMDEQRAIQEILQSAITDDEKEGRLARLSFRDKFWENILAPARHTIALLKFSYQGNEAILTAYPDSLPLESQALEDAALWQVEVGHYRENADIVRQMEAISTLIEEKPSSDLYAMRASFLVAQGNYKDALSALEEAEKIDTSNRWNAYKWGTNMRLIEQSSVNSWKALWDVLQNAEPTSNNLAYIAILQEKDGKLKEAIQTWKRLESLGSLSSADLNNLAVVSLKVQEHHLAQDYLQAAIIKAPDLAEAHYNLAVLFAYRGFTEKTAHHIEKVIAQKPEWLQEIKTHPAFEYVKLDARFEAVVE